MFLASQTVQVTTEAKARPIMTACTRMSADMNIDHGDRSRGSCPTPITGCEGDEGWAGVAAGAGLAGAGEAAAGGVWAAGCCDPGAGGVAVPWPSAVVGRDTRATKINLVSRPAFRRRMLAKRG